MPNYSLEEHPSFSAYLSAVETILRESRVDDAEREQILQSIIEQFEAAALDEGEQAYVARLDAPESYRCENQDRPGPTVAKASPVSAKSIIVIAFILTMAAVVLGLVIMVLYMVSLRNRIVAADETIDGAWAQVETVLQRRYDLIPNLVSTVKGVAKHEAEVLTEVSRLRSQWGAAKNQSEKQATASLMDIQIGKIIAMKEAYPQLRANENFTALQYQLEGTENRIAVQRMRYNEVVRYHNTLTRKFPANLWGFETREEFFKAQPEAATAPKVQF